MSLINSLFPKTVAPNESVSPEENLVDSQLDPVQQQDISVMSHLDSRAMQVIAKAYEAAKAAKRTFIEPEQLLLGLLSDRQVFAMLQEFQVDAAGLNRELETAAGEGSFFGEPTMSDDSKQILESAYNDAKSRGVDFVTPEDILLAIFNKNVTATQKLTARGLDKTKIEAKLAKSSEFQTGKKSFLAQFGTDLTQKAKEGKLDPVTGRDREIERVIHILLRRTKNNPIIIGEAGVGKTAIIEGLAQMIAAGSAPTDLANRRIIQIDVSNLIAGASHRGEFEERLQNVIKEAMASSGQVILFIDEIHTLIGAGDSGGAMDASNIIKPYLSRGQIQVIGTTTTAEYRRYFEKDRAFERRFQAIMCDEPTEEVAEQMIKVLQPKYEAFHKVTFDPAAIKASVHLSKRYIGERFLPDKAIDLMDEAGSQVRLEVASKKRMDNVVHSTDIEKVVSRWTGIPITKLTEKESDKLLRLEELIHKKFINHEMAVKAVSEAVRRGRIGLANANRPIASFIFLGPTGTGKTELAKVLAEIMFGKSDAMIRLDMSEYMEKHEVAKLVGAPPGYVGYEEGGQLTEAVRAKPYSIVLLDEIEKAHPDVFNILLQILEDGRLTDNKGNTISFKNTVIIATSNIGSNLIREFIEKQQSANSHQPSAISGQPGDVSNQPSAISGQPGAVSSQLTAKSQEPQLQPYSYQAMMPSSVTTPASAGANTNSADSQAVVSNDYKALSKIVNDELNKFFKPELLNRFDEVVIFEPLTKENMLLIAKLGVESTRKMLQEQNVGLQLSDKALLQLAEDGYDPAYGARPLRRLIQRTIENPIAMLLIQRTVGMGDTIVIDYSDTEDKFTFSKIPTPGQTPPGQAPVSNTPVKLDPNAIASAPSDATAAANPPASLSPASATSPTVPAPEFTPAYQPVPEQPLAPTPPPSTENQ